MKDKIKSGRCCPFLYRVAFLLRQPYSDGSNCAMVLILPMKAGT